MSAIRKLLWIVSFSLAATAQAKPLTMQVFTADEPGFYVTSTLIEGQKDAILIDAQFTLSAAHRLTAQILESGKTLQAVFMTHAHPDHFFGMQVIRQAFPGVKLYATPEVVEQAKVLAPLKVIEWKPVFGRNLTDAPIIPEAYTFDAFTLEGETINIIKLKPSEAEYNVMFQIPSLKALIVGDAVFNGVHPWLAEANAEHRKNWLENLASIRSLNPKIVVAGHKGPNSMEDQKAVEMTAAYVADFDRIVATAESAEEIKQNMLKKYGQLALPAILDRAAKAAMAEREDHCHGD